MLKEVVHSWIYNDIWNKKRIIRYVHEFSVRIKLYMVYLKAMAFKGIIDILSNGYHIYYYIPIPFTV